MRTEGKLVDFIHFPISKVVFAVLYGLLCFFLGSAIVNLHPRFESVASSLLSWILLSVFFFIASIPFIKVYVRREKINYVEIIYPISLMFILDYGLRTIYVFLHPNSLEVQLRPYILDHKILSISLLYLNIGYICLLLGYYSFIPHRLARSIPSFVKDEYPRENLLLRLILLFLLGLAALVYGALHGDLPIGAVGPGRSVEEFGLHDYIQHFSKYTLYALAIALFTKVYEQSDAGKAFIILLSAYSFSLAFIGGSKGAFFTVIFLFLFWWNYRRGVIRLRSYLLLLVLSLIFIFPWQNTYRGIYRGYFGRSLPTKENLIDSLSSTYRGFSQLSWREYLDTGLRIMMGRQHEIDSLCAIVAQTPDPNPYLYGRDYLWFIPCGLIPRAVWPNKPYLQDRDVFDVDYWHTSKGACAGPPYIGDLYMNFGFPGVIVGMFLMGVLLRFVYLYFVENTEDSSPGLFYYTFIAIELFRIVPEASLGGLSGIIKTSVYYMTIAHLLVKKESKLTLSTLLLLGGAFAFWKLVGARMAGELINLIR